MKQGKSLYNLIESNGNVGEIALVLRALQKGPLEDWALTACVYRQASVSVRIPEPKKLIKATLLLNLIEARNVKKKKAIYLTKLGRQFIKFKTLEKDRLTKEQGKLIFSVAVEKTDILEDILTIMNIFNLSQEGDFWVDGNDTRIDSIEGQILRLFQQLKIATYKDGNIVIKKEDKEWLFVLISSKHDVDIANLMDLLALKRKYGTMAEDFVLQREKERLVDCGRRDLSALVRKISDQNVAAGYDILSFNGNSLEDRYDRFIEVKGSVNDQLIFYISRNEVQVARKLQNKYWIYCVLNVGDIARQKIETINDPYKIIFQKKQFEIEPFLWRISKR